MDFIVQGILALSLVAIITALALWVDKGRDYEDNE